MSVAASSPAWLTRSALSRYSRCFLLRTYRGLEEPEDPVADERCRHRWWRKAEGARKSRKMGVDNGGGRRQCARTHLRSVGSDSIKTVFVRCSREAPKWERNGLVIVWRSRALESWQVRNVMKLRRPKANSRTTFAAFVRHRHFAFCTASLSRIWRCTDPPRAGEALFGGIFALVDLLRALPVPE